MQITMNWDNIEANGKMRKGRKGGKFVSRMTGRTADGTKPESKLHHKLRRKFSVKVQLEKGPDYEIKEAKDGTFFYQPRVNGKFGPRQVISEKLAKSLME